MNLGKCPSCLDGYAVCRCGGPEIRVDYTKLSVAELSKAMLEITAEMYKRLHPAQSFKTETHEHSYEQMVEKFGNADKLLQEVAVGWKALSEKHGGGLRRGEFTTFAALPVFTGQKVSE